MNRILLLLLLSLGFYACENISTAGFEVIDRQEFGEDVGPIALVPAANYKLAIDTTQNLGSISNVYVGNQEGLEARTLLRFASNKNRTKNWPTDYKFNPIVRLVLFKAEVDTTFKDGKFDIQAYQSTNTWTESKVSWDSTGAEIWEGGDILDLMGTGIQPDTRVDSIALVIELTEFESSKDWNDTIIDTLNLILVADTACNQIDFFSSRNGSYAPQLWFMFPTAPNGSTFTDTVKYKATADAAIVGYSQLDESSFYIASGHPVRTELDLSAFLNAVPENATITNAELTIPIMSLRNYEMRIGAYWSEDTSFSLRPDDAYTILITDTIIKMQVPELVTAWVDRDTNFNSGKIFLGPVDKNLEGNIVKINPAEIKLNYSYSLPPEVWHGEK